MGGRKTLTYFETVVNRVSRFLNWVACSAVLAMMSITSLDVILRFFFNRPIYGSVDIVIFLQAIAVAFALAYTFMVRGHVTVDVIVSRLPERARAIVDSITCSLTIGVFLLLAWRNTIYATDLWRTGTLSYTLWVPFFPIVYAITFACVLVCLVLLLDLFKSLGRVTKK